MPDLALDAIEARAAALPSGWVATHDNHGPRKGIDHAVWSEAPGYYIAELVTSEEAADWIAEAPELVMTLVAAARERDALLAAKDARIAKLEAGLRELIAGSEEFVKQVQQW